MTRLSAQHPTWLRDIDATLPVTASFVLHGNVRDRYMVPVGDRVLPTDLYSALWDTLSRSGFEALIAVTPVGVRVLPATAGPVAEAVLGTAPDRVQEVGPAQLTAFLRAVVRSAQRRVALVIDYVSQWRPHGEPFTDAEHALMQSALIEVHGAQPFAIGGARPVPVYNPVFWVVDRPADLPPWLVSAADGIRQIPIPAPDLTERGKLAELLLAHRSEDPTAMEKFATATEGMPLKAMVEITRLADDQNKPPAEIEDAVRAHRVGLLDNPWGRDMVRRRVRTGEALLSHRVRGQHRAIRHALDILIRSTMGLTGAERGGRAGGPRGILFFAGPTGVGKTELAKAIAELIFGDERAYIRFDMSEFSAEQSDARLIGSPPGYVGHGQGGELTNAVRQRPFSVVLFDEIEKAHRRILDKFLQILSDGRLTDGSGDTVHFTESLIVFTSNLGVPKLVPGQRAPRGEELEKIVREAIEYDFTHQLDRPELLGRIGQDNIVVFDYIDHDTAVGLAHQFIDNVLSVCREKTKQEIDLAPAVRDELVAEAVADLTLGGRGITRAVESLFVNPLARALFVHESSHCGVQVVGRRREEGGWDTLLLN